LTWELRRDKEKRTVVVELCGAVESRGRTVAEAKCLDARDATSIVKVTATASSCC
jgi:hypothetical protein